jgi:hypothetical protein
MSGATQRNYLFATKYRSSYKINIYESNIPKNLSTAYMSFNCQRNYFFNLKLHTYADKQSIAADIPPQLHEVLTGVKTSMLVLRV